MEFRNDIEEMLTDGLRTISEVNTVLEHYDAGNFSADDVKFLLSYLKKMRVCAKCKNKE